MKKSTIITIILISIFLFLIIIGIACVGIIKYFNKPEIKTNKDTIYEIHILAELTDESYNEFINKVNCSKYICR